jgi:uncharacterized paraquat-inducible protein A
MQRSQGMGPMGYCVCPNCNYKTPHRRGTPCQEEKCPRCGTKMLREGSYHHDLSEKKKKRKN